MTTLEQIKQHKLVCILRGIPAELAIDTAAALYQGGVRILEVTFNTEGAADIIYKLRQQFDGKLLIGAGTVLDCDTAKTAIASGAEFLLSPILDSSMIAECNRSSKLAIPGVFSPTEMVTAVRLGAPIVKLFPAATLGADYIKQILAPLDNLSIMAVGGITAANARDYINAGACSVGAGSSLLNMTHVHERKFDKISETAKKFTESLKHKIP